MQTRSYIPRPSPVLLSSSPVVHKLPVRAHLVQRCETGRRIAASVFWLQAKSEGTFLLTHPFVWPPSQKSHPDWSSSVFIYLICSGNLSFLHRSNHSLPPLFNQDPCCHQTLHPPVDTSDRKVYSCSFLSASSSFIFPPYHPSLSPPIPHSGRLPSFLDTPQLMYLTRGPPRLSPSLPLHPSAVRYPRRLSSSRFSEMDLLLELFSLGWVNTEDSAELPADLLFSICWGHLAGFALLCFFFFLFLHKWFCTILFSRCECMYVHAWATFVDANV